MVERGQLAPELRRARVEVDLGALERNFDRLAARVAPAGVLAVVKADAYGHGAVEVARALEPRGVAGFAVALVEEALELRQAGVKAPILVLSPVPAAAFPFLRRYALVPVVSSLDQLGLLDAHARAASWSLGVHLKFDTGMHRLGIPSEAAAAALDRVRDSPVLRLEGVMSHLAEAESPESPANREQQARFERVLSELGAGERQRVAVHFANSAGALYQPGQRHDLVRLGLALYGIDPARPRAAGELEPALSLVAEIVETREVATGGRVGYGGRWVAERPSRLAIVPVGYADGYSWRLGSRAEAIARGRRVPVAGAISMDMLALDVTASGGDAGEQVVLLGRRDGAEVSVAELAAAVGTLPYELLCLFGLRLPRVAKRGGVAVDAPAGEPSREIRASR